MILQCHPKFKKNIWKQTTSKTILQPTFHPKKKFMVSRSKQILCLCNVLGSNLEMAQTSEHYYIVTDGGTEKLNELICLLVDICYII